MMCQIGDADSLFFSKKAEAYTFEANMKLLSILSVCLLVTTSGLLAESMHAYLQETNRLTRSGQYEEALERHVWFHAHALEQEPSMVGVRLSFALSHWMELGKKYPPALDKLKAIRNEGEALLKDGGGSFETFHDVSAINRVLGEDAATLALFKELEVLQAELAASLWIVTKDIAFQFKEYDLINRHLPDVERAYRTAYAGYLRDFSTFQNGNHIDWVRSRFRKEVAQLAELARYNGDDAIALKIQDRAEKVLVSEDGLVD